MISELKKIGLSTIKWPSGENYILAERKITGAKVDIPVVTGNKLIIGKIGYGKTTLVKELISADIRENDTYLFGFEVKQGDYSETFMSPGGLIISYRDIPGKEDKMFKWGMVKEIKESDDPEAEIKKMASFLTQHLKKDPGKEIWAQGAAETFEGFMNSIIHCIDGTPSNYDVVQRMRTMSTVNLLKFMAHYKPNKSLLEKYYHFDINWGTDTSDETKRKLETYKIPQVGSDILVFLQNMLSNFSGSFLSKDGQHTIKGWLSGKYGKTLFLSYDLSKKDVMTVFAVYFLQSVILERISSKVDKTKRILMVLDEVPEIGQEFFLEQGVTVGRENRLEIIVSTQSLEKLYSIAPDLNPAKTEHYTNAMLAGFTTYACFQAGDPYTINTFQKFFGNRTKLPVSRYSTMSGLTVSPIVTDEDFATLGIGECYIKIGASEPERLYIVKTKWG